MFVVSIYVHQTFKKKIRVSMGYHYLLIISVLMFSLFSFYLSEIEIAEKGPNSELSRDFFREEYTLNHKISVLGVPYISLINGICMGGVCVLKLVLYDE